MKFVLVVITLLSVVSCKTIQCREYHRRYTECSNGTSLPPLGDERVWTEWCESTPPELVKLECTHERTCEKFLNCVNTKQ